MEKTAGTRTGTIDVALINDEAKTFASFRSNQCIL